MAQHPEPPPPCPDSQNTRTLRRSRHLRHCSPPRLESPPGKQGGDNSDKTTTTTRAAAPTDTTRTTRKECTQEHPLSWIQFHMKIQQWLNPNPNVPMSACRKFAQQLEASHAKGSTETTSCFNGTEAEAVAIHFAKSHGAMGLWDPS